MEELIKSYLNDPEPYRTAINEFWNSIKPEIKYFKTILTDIVREILKDTKSLQMEIAQFRRNMYDMYLAQGFTEEQAMCLIISDLKFLRELSDKQQVNKK